MDNLEQSDVDFIESIEPTDGAEFEAPNYKTADEQQAEAAAEQAEGAMMADMALGVVESVLRMKWPAVAFDATARADAVEKLGALLAKYGGAMPQWLVPYQAEISAAMSLGGLGFGVYQSIAFAPAIEQAEAVEVAQ